MVYGFRMVGMAHGFTFTSSWVSPPPPPRYYAIHSTSTLKTVILRAYSDSKSVVANDGKVRCVQYTDQQSCLLCFCSVVVVVVVVVLVSAQQQTLYHTTWACNASLSSLYNQNCIVDVFSCCVGNSQGMRMMMLLMIRRTWLVWKSSSLYWMNG